MARLDVLTGMGPVLAFLLLGVRWKRREPRPSLSVGIALTALIAPRDCC